jgi:hypothetical protein
MQPRLHLFIGAAADQLGLAHAATRALHCPESRATVWEDGIDTATQSSIRAFLEALAHFDAGVLVLSQRDLMPGATIQRQLAREALIFHAGMLIGQLGPKRVFLLLPQRARFVPDHSLWLGLFSPRYAPRHPEGLAAGMREACDSIRRRLRLLEGGGLRPHPEDYLTGTNELEPLVALGSWLAHGPRFIGRHMIDYHQVEAELGLEQGASQDMLLAVARARGYYPVRMSSAGMRLAPEDDASAAGDEMDLLDEGEPDA